jgi:hypothetical protein
VKIVWTRGVRASAGEDGFAVEGFCGNSMGGGIGVGNSMAGGILVDSISQEGVNVGAKGLLFTAGLGPQWQTESIVNRHLQGQVTGCHFVRCLVSVDVGAHKTSPRSHKSISPGGESHQQAGGEKELWRRIHAVMLRFQL